MKITKTGEHKLKSLIFRQENFSLLLLFTCSILNMYTCNSQKTSDLSWSKHCLEKFEQEYEYYIEHDYINCLEKARDLDFDKRRKLFALSRYSLDSLLFHLEETNVDGIFFDSLLIVTKHFHAFEVEGFKPFAMILLYSNGTYKTFDTRLDEFPIFDKENIKPYPIDKLRALENGCDLGFEIVTHINTKFEFKISKIVINNYVE